MPFIAGNRYLNEEEQTNNAALIATYLSSRSWSLNAIAALLGNMESESTINPGIWQNLDEGNTALGFGFVQWTPSTNYTNWATSKGYAIDDGYGQLEWINTQTVPFGQWIKTSDYDIDFEAFKTSTNSCEWLASAFLKNFERAGIEVEEERRTQARKWFDLLSDSDSGGEDGGGGTITVTTPKRKRYNFILFGPQRKKRWQR